MSIDRKKACISEVVDCERLPSKRLLQQIARDPELRAIWASHYRLQALMHGQYETLDKDFSAKLSRALRQERVPARARVSRYLWPLLPSRRVAGFAFALLMVLGASGLFFSDWGRLVTARSGLDIQPQLQALQLQGEWQASLNQYLFEHIVQSGYGFQGIANYSRLPQQFLEQR